MKAIVRPRARLAARGAALLLLSVPAMAQDKVTGSPQDGASQPEPEKSLKEYREILQSRNRDTMHPGDPLLLIGVDQDGNDMRKSTPILEQSDKKIVMVDQDEAYQRALALYAAGATFKSPMAAATDGDGAAHSKPKSRPASRSSVPEAGPQWPWLVATAICVAFIVWLGRRFSEPKQHPTPS